jgi:hypothetical protein
MMTAVVTDDDSASSEIYSSVASAYREVHKEEHAEKIRSEFHS